jgi:hypothetical protein
LELAPRASRSQLTKTFDRTTKSASRPKGEGRDAGMTPAARSLQAGDKRSAAILGRRMTKKQSVRLSNALALSIVLVMMGFLGLGIRAFTSAATSDLIYFVAFGVFLTALTIYFVLRRPRAGVAIDRKIRRLPSARSGPAPLHIALGQRDRRRPPVLGQPRVAVAHERRIAQLAGIRVGGLELNASKTLRA